MNEERMRILELLEKGQITAGEAAELLKALGEEPRREQARQWHRQGGQGRWFRVRVSERGSGRERANFAVPLSLLNFPFGMAKGFGMWRSHGQMDEILEAVRHGRSGTIFDVSDAEHGDRVEIIVE